MKNHVFLTANIDRAIVMTQYDLRGFAHPLGFREKPKSSAKSLWCITGNLLAFAADAGHGAPTDPNFICYFDDVFEFEAYLAMCQRLAEHCDESEKEAIQLIIQDIVKQTLEMKLEVTKGTRKPSKYLASLDKNSRWGRAILALAEAFHVDLQEMIAQDAALAGS